MSLSPLYVTGLGLWSPGFADVSAWRERRPDPSVERPPCALVNSRLKRGSSRFANMLGEVVEQAARAGGADVSLVSTVYGSSLGEIDTMVTLLRMLFEEEGKLSPNRFKNSVHNAASGLVSIGTQNTHFTTAIGGGDATFELSLLEAWALLGDEDVAEVVLAVADDALPPPLDRFRSHGGLALGFCLSSTPREGAARLESLRPGAAESTAYLPEGLAGNATSAGLALLEATLARRATTVSLAMAGREGFLVDVVPV